MMRVAVVGHVEWVHFARVERIPASGEIVHASDFWECAGGGGAVSAAALAELNGSVSFFTAFGDDALGHRAHDELVSSGISVHATFRPVSTRRAFTHIDADGERTITVLGDRLGPRGADTLPWNELDGADAVYFTSGDAEAVHKARGSRVLVATSRDIPPLAEAGVSLDALIGSSTDASEIYTPGDLDPAPDLIVWTEGERGGRYQVRGGPEARYEAVQIEGPIANRYGAGDSFAAGLTYGLARQDSIGAALELGARCAAGALRA
jgi:ribokinase